MNYMFGKWLPRWFSGKESTCQAGHTRDAGLIPGLVRSPGEANANPLQYSCLGNPKDRGAWWSTVHGVGHDGATNTTETCLDQGHGGGCWELVSYFNGKYEGLVSPPVESLIHLEIRP